MGREESHAYNERNLEWKVLDLPVNGTATVPDDDKMHSAIVFVAGSGPTDRNWCSPLLPGSNGSAKLLAEKLSEIGYITIRYDKLASGPGVRERAELFKGKLSMDTHLQELSGAVGTLLLEFGHRINKIFVVADSEGTIHAVNYQLKEKTHKFSGLVLVSPPGRPVGAVARDQIMHQVDQIPDAKVLMEHYDSAIETFLNGGSMKDDTVLPVQLKQFVASLYNPYNLPFSREFWNYDLSDHLGAISDPVLVIIGKKDIQVDWRVDGDCLKNAAGEKRNFSFYFPDNANHILKHEDREKADLDVQYVSKNYNADGRELDGEAFDHIVRWIRDTEAGPKQELNP